MSFEDNNFSITAESHTPVGAWASLERDAISFGERFSTFRTSQCFHLQGQLNVVDYTCRCYTLNEYNIKIS